MSPTAAASAIGSVSTRIRFHDRTWKLGTSGAVPRSTSSVTVTSTTPIATLAQKNAVRPAFRTTSRMNSPDSVACRITPRIEIQPIRSCALSGTV